MDTGLAGKTVIVTGATANIGRAIALAFAAESANVVIVGRDEEQGRRVAQAALEGGASAAVWRKTDVLRREEVQGLVDETLDRFSGIDVLVNSVGGNTSFGPFAESDPEQWRAELDLNIMSTLYCTRAVLPSMIARQSGCIINMGSTAGIVGDRLLAVYSASKGAVHSFTKILAVEVGGSGVRVNAIAPYGTLPEAGETSSGSRFHPEFGLLTELQRTRSAELLTVSRSTALQRPFAKPSEIGAAAVYLASEQAAFITAQVLCVDGGVQVA